MGKHQTTAVGRVAALVRTVALAGISTLVFAAAAGAYPQYSQTSGSATYCRACHGNFRATSYISPHDGLNWGNLHNLHRNTMLSGDCQTCHQPSTDFPVILLQSGGGTGLSPISCAGCHGRGEDNVPANPEVAAGRSGYGAGLRQHHFTTGTTICTTCHLDADPANYTPVGEQVLPDYYAHPGTGHASMPRQSCNGDGRENFAGAPEGLDNDGDDAYDGADAQCAATGIESLTASSVGGFGPSRNYPNPFVTSTVIEYELTHEARVEVRILGADGRLVRHLAASGAAAGQHRVEWDGRDEAGKNVPSGIYFYELRSGDVRSLGAMVLAH